MLSAVVNCILIYSMSSESVGLSHYVGTCTELYGPHFRLLNWAFHCGWITLIKVYCQMHNGSHRHSHINTARSLSCRLNLKWRHFGYITVERRRESAPSLHFLRGIPPAAVTEIGVWLDNLFQLGKERGWGGTGKVVLNVETKAEEKVILLIRNCQMVPQQQKIVVTAQ